VIADQSVNYVERFIIDGGHTAQRIEKDYGCDLMMFTFNEQGYAEPGLVWLQLKASESWPLIGSDHYYDLDIRDYNLWMLQELPVILILFDAGRRKAYWVAVQHYFSRNPARPPLKGAKKVRVHVSKRQVLNLGAIAKMRALKQEALRRPVRYPS
jgi:hypothetical protein